MSSVAADELNIDAGNSENTGKIVFFLRAAGGAPILKRKKWEVPRSKTLGSIAEFLRKHLELGADGQTQIILYVNQAFAPAVDTTIGAISDCFLSEGHLVLHYSLTPAWG